MKEQNYAATYKFGKSTVHVVAPTITEEEKEQVLNQFHYAGWAIIDRLEQEQQEKDRLSS